MPRYRRLVIPDCPHHLTQRGNHRQTVFLSDEDRSVYLGLVRKNAQDCNVRLLGYCLMSNHVHWIVLPSDEAGLADAFGRAHCRYSHYFQAKLGTTGHLWQNRFYSCALSPSHVSAAMLYVEQNPVRAGMAHHADAYPWSSANAHILGSDPLNVIDAQWWNHWNPPWAWGALLREASDPAAGQLLQRCTYAGKPCGEKTFLAEIRKSTGLDVTLRLRGRPPRRSDESVPPPTLMEMGKC